MAKLTLFCLLLMRRALSSGDSRQDWICSEMLMTGRGVYDDSTSDILYKIELSISLEEAYNH